MIKVLIVDDDAVNRAAIATMIDWNSLGCEIVFEAEEGQTALTYLMNNPVHLVITDMKMPIMNGLELITEIRMKKIECEIIVVSSYNEFDMVREAFKLGVKEYYLKSELNDVYFYEFIQRIRTKINISQEVYGIEQQSIQTIKNTFREDALGLNEIQVEQYKEYYILILQLEGIDHLRQRFPNIKRDLMLPLYEVLKQIPKVSKNCEITNYSESKILIYYQGDEDINMVTSLCERMILVVQNYLNVNIRIGVSAYGTDGSQLHACVRQAVENITLRYIYGSKKIFTMEMNHSFALEKAMETQEEFTGIITSLKEGNDSQLSMKQSELFHGKCYENVAEMRKKALHMILFESIFLEDMGDNIWNAFPERVDYERKLNRLATSNEVLMWSANFNRWIMDYLKNRYHEEQQNDSIQTVKRYLEDNYSNGNLTLGEVADVMGLNEQYFCSKFRKECGVSFVEYLTNLRVEKAKNLIVNTNIKMYEVGEAVGYNSVEHFNRVFRKKTGQTPKEYQKANKR